MIMGQMEQMKMVQMAAGCAPLKTNKPMGNQASGDTGRSKLIKGLNMREAHSKRPSMNPAGMPTKAAKPKPTATRFKELRMFQPMP